VVPQALSKTMAMNAARTAKARLRRSAWVKVIAGKVINSYSQVCKNFLHGGFRKPKRFALQIILFGSCFSDCFFVYLSKSA